MADVPFYRNVEKNVKKKLANACKSGLKDIESCIQSSKIWYGRSYL